MIHKIVKLYVEKHLGKKLLELASLHVSVVYVFDIGIMREYQNFKLSVIKSSGGFNRGQRFF